MDQLIIYYNFYMPSEIPINPIPNPQNGEKVN